MSLFISPLVGFIGLYLFLFSDVIAPDVIRQEVPLLKLAVCILLGYLIADFGIRAANPASDVCDWSMFLHHVLTLYAGHSSAASADLPYYQVLWTLMELPNIFNCLRVILKELGQKTSLIYVLNGLALTLVTFLTNVAPIPLFWYHMIPLVQSEAFSEVTFGMKVATFVLSPIMHILQCFWFFKVCRGAFEYFFGKTVRKQN
ncbi:PREDICTED: transmembrane protein 56-like [Branchiostoma belcheri]|uniref:Transmembrane protein 56-like n=1 Tax=Branchiostoma belcheri TaxID=7741 RepID=A0A6P4Z4L3_BRABE|nr:PREDICTED: transmembrane protein 56-like [Branchiostoma belcheri]